jgi:hypothetical protein
LAAPNGAAAGGRAAALDEEQVPFESTAIGEPETDSDRPVKIPTILPLSTGTIPLSTGDVLERAALDLAVTIIEEPAVPAVSLAMSLSPERAATLDELSNRGEPGTVLLPLTDFDEIAVNSTVQADSPLAIEKSESNIEAMT